MTDNVIGVRKAGAEVAPAEGDNSHDAVGKNKPTEVKTAQIQLAPVSSSIKLGVWFFLGSEVILFGALILTYLVFRITFPGQYADFRSHLSIPLITGNTLILILSSYFVVRALEAARHSDRQASALNLLIVLALGAVFIYGQAYEWSTLFARGIRLDNTFGSPFYVVTGIHGMHVLVGLAWACLLLFFGMEAGANDSAAHSMEIFGLYWHFVDIVWIVLFSLIYLL